MLPGATWTPGSWDFFLYSLKAAFRSFDIPFIESPYLVPISVLPSLRSLFVAFGLCIKYKTGNTALSRAGKDEFRLCYVEEAR